MPLGEAVLIGSMVLALMLGAYAPWWATAPTRDPLRLRWWYRRNSAVAAEYGRLGIHGEDARTTNRNGWTPDRIKNLAGLTETGGGPRIYMSSRAYTEIITSITADRYDAWQPHLGAVLLNKPNARYQMNANEVHALVAWDDIAGPLAPLAARAGIPQYEAQQMAARGELTESGLLTLIHLYGDDGAPTAGGQACRSCGHWSSTLSGPPTATCRCTAVSVR
jgi:hypothetical protein